MRSDLKVWLCDKCGRTQRSRTSPLRWRNLCASCDPYTAAERRAYSRGWFDATRAARVPRARTAPAQSVSVLPGGKPYVHPTQPALPL